MPTILPSSLPTIFDVFLSYNSKDREFVEELGQWLRLQKLKVWFDKWELRPGLPWQEDLELGISQSNCIAVVLGPSGLGPWEIPEMRAALSEYASRKRPVIPVILPGCENPDLPMFLKAYTWVDCRSGLDNREVEKNLVWGITGDKNRKIVSRYSPNIAKKRPTIEPVFIFNNISGSLKDFFESTIRPVIDSSKLGFKTLSDIEKSTDRARLLEEATFDASIIIIVLNESSPSVPLSLLSPISPSTDLIVLVERNIEPPEVLSYGTIIRYTTNPKGISKLQQSLKNVIELSLSGDRLRESEKLYSYGFLMPQ